MRVLVFMIAVMTNALISAETLAANRYVQPNTGPSIASSDAFRLLGAIGGI